MTWRDAEKFVGRNIFDKDVPTPFVFIDLTTLKRNIAHMQALVQTAGVNLRPHIKTHKIAEIARMQLQAGACGLTVAKLGEAQALYGRGHPNQFHGRSTLRGHRESAMGIENGGKLRIACLP